MGGNCHYSCFLLYQGSASFIAVNFDSIRAYQPRYDSDPIIVRSLMSTDYHTCSKQKNCTVKQDGERHNPQEKATDDG